MNSSYLALLGEGDTPGAQAGVHQGGQGGQLQVFAPNAFRGPVIDKHRCMAVANTSHVGLQRAEPGPLVNPNPRLNPIAHLGQVLSLAQVLQLVTAPGKAATPDAVPPHAAPGPSVLTSHSLRSSSGSSTASL